MAELNAGRTDSQTADSDERLLAQLRGGEAEAFEELVQTNIGRMLVVARRLVGNDEDASDVVQDAFLSAFKGIGKFDGKSRLGTWLHRIAVNAALMKLRSARSRSAQSIEELLPAFLKDGHQSDPGPRWQEPAEAILLRQESREQIQAGIRRLPEDFRDVLMLRDIEEFSTDEAAELLGVTTAVVKTRLHRARQALRTLLEPYVLRGES